MRSERCDRSGITLSSGAHIPYHRDTKRDYVSIFGKVAIWRPYFYKSGCSGHSPLDAELSLGEDSHSDLVREISAYLNVDGVYHKTGEFLGRLLGLSLSTRLMQGVIKEDATLVVDYYAQKPAPDPASEAEILAALRRLFDWQVSRDTWPVKPTEIAAWRGILGLLQHR
jgi:hypothetical protein